MKPVFDNTPTPIGPLLEDGIRLAVNSFPANSGLGGDNIAPKAIARLSRPAIRALIAFFLFFEASGEWCQAVNVVLTVLLPKPDGGGNRSNSSPPSFASG